MCQTCQDIIDHCSDCTVDADTATCTNCADGYQLYQGKCDICSNIITSCINC